MCEGKDKLIEAHQLTLENHVYWQKKENMSPWKVFSSKLFSEKSLLWLFFRIHKLCGAKYNYFSVNLHKWTPFRFNERNRVVILKLEDIAYAEGFLHERSNIFITMAKLQLIKDKQVFEELVDYIENYAVL